jgi:S1-C subfamily serine protease
MLTDGGIFNGKVIGIDETADLAVIELDSTETLPFAALGNSDDLKIGQIVIAIACYLPDTDKIQNNHKAASLEL